MESLEKYYRRFISNVLQTEKSTPEHNLQEILYNLLNILRFRFRVNPGETFDELRQIEKRIESDLSHRFYRTFMAALEQTDVWSVFNKAIESETAYSSKMFQKKKAWFPKAKNRELLLRPRHLMFLLWQSKELNATMGWLAYTMEHAPTIVHSVVPAETLERSFVHVKRNRIVLPVLYKGQVYGEEIIDRRLIEAAHFRDRIEESSYLIFSLLSNHFDLLCQQQRKLTEEIEHFGEDLRELADWARNFKPNECTLQTGGMQ